MQNMELHLLCWSHDIDSIKTRTGLMINNQIFDVFQDRTVDSCN